MKPPAGARTVDTAADTGPPIAVWVGGSTALQATEGTSDAVFEGLLHNADELRAELALPEAGPADLVLRGYSRWGVDVISHLRGAFALLVRDQRRQTAFCARDPVGIHPLFYANAGGSLLISTSIEALLQEPGVSRSVSRVALAEHLCNRWVDREATYFEAVRRVPPGHVLEASRSGERLRRYWDPAPRGESVEWVSEAELGRFDELFDQAIERCLGDGRTGIFLSGGLDSVSIAAVAAERCRSSGRPDPYALSLIFPHPEVTEEVVQRGVAAALGLPQVRMGLSEAVGNRDMLAAALELCRTWPAPPTGLWLPAYQSLGLEGRRRECTTILTGHGGDEWLTVTPTYAANLLSRGDLVGLYRLGQAHRRSFRMPLWRVIHSLLWRFGARPVLAGGAAAAMARVAPAALQARRRRQIARATPDWVAPDPALRQAVEQRALVEPGAQLGDFYLRELRESLDHPLVAMEHEENFENARRMGVRLAYPFVDPDLVDFLYRVPPELLSRGGRAKGLVRQTLSTRFPGLGFERQRKVVATPFVEPRLAEEAPRAWKAMGGTPALAETGIVDLPGVTRIVREASAPGVQKSALYSLWSILSVETWLRARI